MNIHSKILLLLATLFGMTSVILDAVGAHMLYDSLVAQQQLSIFAKAIDYAMYGGITLIAIAILQIYYPKSRYFISGYLIGLGTLIFSGTLFISTIADEKVVLVMTPWGGTLLIIGWVSIGMVTILQKKTNA